MTPRSLTFTVTYCPHFLCQPQHQKFLPIPGRDAVPLCCGADSVSERDRLRRRVDLVALDCDWHWQCRRFKQCDRDPVAHCRPGAAFSFVLTLRVFCFIRCVHLPALFQRFPLAHQVWWLVSILCILVPYLRDEIEMEDSFDRGTFDRDTKSNSAPGCLRSSWASITDRSSLFFVGLIMTSLASPSLLHAPLFVALILCILAWSNLGLSPRSGLFSALWAAPTDLESLSSSMALSASPPSLLKLVLVAVGFGYCGLHMLLFHLVQIGSVRSLLSGDALRFLGLPSVLPLYRNNSDLDASVRFHMHNSLRTSRFGEPKKFVSVPCLLTSRIL
jgi:hypothetical protein